MKGVDCKLPIQEDRVFLNKGRNISYSGSRKVAVVAGILLIVAMALMIVFTFQSINGINELKKEIEDLRVSLQTLQEKIADCNDTNSKNVPNSEKHPKIDDYNYEDYSYDENIDYYDDDGGNTDATSDDNVLPLTGQQFTKDAKMTIPSPRLKRNIGGYNQDDTSPKTEASTQTKRRNVTFKKNYQNYQYSTPPTLSAYTYLGQTTPSARLLHSRRIHVNHHDGNFKQTHQPVKLSALKSGDSFNTEDSPDVEFTVVTDDHLDRTRHRQRRLELDERSVRTGRIRPLPAAHFSGDTSKYVLGQHDNFNGNGHLRHPQRTFVDWMESSWFHTLGMDRHFTLTDGILTIKESGLYFIYAQIYYYDEHDMNGFRVYKNENETLLQCTTMTHSAERVMKGNTCYTAGAEYFNENDRVSLGDLSESRYSLFEPGKSFFGVIKLGDVKIK